MRKQKKVILISGAFIIAVFLLVSFVSKKYVAPILMYHSVNPKPFAGKMLTVSPRCFQRQMRFLKIHHYNVMPLADLAALIKGKRKIPRNTVAITLDDGYKDNYTYAFPILKKYNFPATIFIIVNEVDRKEGDRLTWKEIKMMQDSGLIDFESHTLTHPYLTELKSDQQLKDEIFDSRKVLEDKLGTGVSIFCYPSGKFNSKVRQLVIDAGYKIAVASNPGINYPDDDLFALKRLRISENSNNLFVFWIESSGYYNFIREHKSKRN